MANPIQAIILRPCARISSACEPCGIGSNEESLLMSGQGASVRVILIPTRHTCSNAGKTGERNGTHLWQEITAQGYLGLQRMVYRFLKTLKTHEIEASAEGHHLPHYSSTATISLFMRHDIDSYDG